MIAGAGLDDSVLVEWPAPERFACRTAPGGADVLRFTNGLVQLRVPAGTALGAHPYLGPYLTVWLEAAVTAPRAFTDLTIREAHGSGIVNRLEAGRGLP